MKIGLFLFILIALSFWVFSLIMTNDSINQLWNLLLLILWIILIPIHYFKEREK